MLETIVKLLQEILAALNRLQVPAVGTIVMPTISEIKAKQAEMNAPQGPASADPFASSAQSAVGDPLVKAAADVVVPTVPTREDVGKALIELATSKGRDAAVAALASVSAVALKDVTIDKYPAILAAIKKLS